jgi:hypothetical protein
MLIIYYYGKVNYYISIELNLKIISLNNQNMLILGGEGLVGAKKQGYRVQ